MYLSPIFSVRSRLLPSSLTEPWRTRHVIWSFEYSSAFFSVGLLALHQRDIWHFATIPPLFPIGVQMFLTCCLAKNPGHALNLIRQSRPCP